MLCIQVNKDNLNENYGENKYWLNMDLTLFGITFQLFELLCLAKDH